MDNTSLPAAVKAPTIKTSFFDEPPSTESMSGIWKKKTAMKNPSEVRLQEGLWFKKSTRTNFWKSRYYVLFEDRLAYFKSAREKESSAYCIVNNMRVEKIFADEKEKEKEEKFGLRFIHNNQYFELFTRGQDVQEKWFQSLLKFCVLTNYSSSFVNIKAIGKGSFARVFLAKRKTDNSELAVKTFDKNMLGNVDKAKPSLINEINIMRKLEHDSIIKLFEVYESDNHIYLVLEVLHGGELFERIVKKGQYKEGDACILMSNLISALAFLHAKGIMHRDLKPENLILKGNDNDWDVKIADFGLSQVITANEYLFKRCGTPGYVAPEILADEKYDEKVDIFSAGVILYILLSGCSPFHGRSYNEILWKNKNCDIHYDFKAYGQRVSESAVDLMKKMLAKDPKQRISAQEALEHPWIQTNGVFNSPRTNNPVFLSSAQQNMRKFQEENRFNVKNIKPQGLDKPELDRPSHAPSPLINGRTLSVANSTPFQSPDIRKPGAKPTVNMAKFFGTAPAQGASMTSTKDGESESVLSEEQAFVNVNLGGYSVNQGLLSQLTDNSGSNRSSIQGTPIIPKKINKPTAKKALNVQGTLLKYLGMPSSVEKKDTSDNKENKAVVANVAKKLKMLE